ncbi:MAG: NirD/YgiW/YdeI family stress tolerance protein [Candidatus Cloacimonetes bacterium]|nr:NirD/YgiW/YdeI family stress tolerance protein [Candidatus Cloacimonadota bacterium]
MSKKLIILICIIAMLGFTVPIFAQQTPVGPGGFVGPMTHGFGGYDGPSAIITVNQTAMFPNKTPVIMRGNIIQAISHDRFIFRDETGDISVKIKRDRWWGQTVTPEDTIEISGDFKRDKRNWQVVHVDVKLLKKL